MNWGFSKVNFWFEAVLCLTFLIILSYDKNWCNSIRFLLSWFCRSRCLTCAYKFGINSGVYWSDILKDFMYHSNIFKTNIFFKITDVIPILEVYFSKWIKTILHIHIFSRWNSVAPIFKKRSRSIIFQFRFSCNTLKKIVRIFLCVFSLLWFFKKNLWISEKILMNF